MRVDVAVFVNLDVSEQAGHIDDESENVVVLVELELKYVVHCECVAGIDDPEEEGVEYYWPAAEIAAAASDEQLVVAGCDDSLVAA